MRFMEPLQNQEHGLSLVPKHGLSSGGALYKIANIAQKMVEPGVLDVFWMCFGCLFDVFWVSFGCVLDVFLDVL